MAKKKQKTPISDQLRRHIETCGRTRYSISKESGIDQAALSRFFAGSHGMSLGSLDAICLVLDLELVPRGGQASKEGA